jgi:hypothetical protein
MLKFGEHKVSACDSFYLVIKRKLNNDISIVDSCEKYFHVNVIVKKYCDENDIKFVKNRSEINQVCNETNQKYCYSDYVNHYVILDCTFHPENRIFSSYVEKYDVSYLEIHFHKIIPMKKRLIIESQLVRENSNNN